MAEQVEDFIGVYDNILPDGLCERLVDFYEELKESGLTKNRGDRPGYLVSDESFSVADSFFDYGVSVAHVSGLITPHFWEKGYLPYAQRFDVISRMKEHQVYEMRLQKTEPGQGYHVWHAENEGRETSNRLLAWMLYLNDIEDGGETEFLYLKKRFKPVKNRLLIWPTSFTHTHRGNQPIDQDKYILTGWVEF